MTRNTLFAGMLIGATAGVFATSATAADAKKARTPYVSGEILVTFKESALASTQAMRVNNLSRGKAVKTIRRFNLQRVKLPADVSVAQAIKTYEGQSAVVSVQPNYRYYKLADSREVSDQEVFRFGADAVAQGKKKPGQPKAVKPKSFKPNDKEYKAQWNMRTINAPIAWENTKNNAEVVVAVIDTGVNYQHQDLADNMWRNPMEIPGNGADDDNNGYIDDYYGIDTVNADSDPRDIDGHGTHVAGVIGARINNRVGIAGLNWNAKIMALRVLGVEGGTTVGIVEAMDYIIDMRERGINVRVANHSYGAERIAGTPFNQAEKAALDAAAEAGILSAIAAGNGGADGVGDDNNINPAFPAGYTSPGIISVAATNEDDRFARFSNYGSRSVDLAAPGESILSTYPYEFKKVKVPSGTPAPGATPTPVVTPAPGATPTPRPTQPPGGTPPPVATPPRSSATNVGTLASIVVQEPSNKGYKLLSGTSMAAPHVAGAAAMLFGYGGASGKDFTLQQVKNFILEGADKVPQLKGKLKSGDRDDPLNPESTRNGGRLNVAVSLTLAGASTGVPLPTPTPGPTPDPNATPTPLPTPTAIPTSPPLENGSIFYTEADNGFFATINRVPDVIFIGDDRREKQNPYVSLTTGLVAYTVNLANVTNPGFNQVDFFGSEGTYSFEENEIFVQSANGATTIRVTDDESNDIDPVDDREPAISPDGKRIVWVRRNQGGNDDIYIANTLQDPNNPRRSPQMFKLVGDNGNRVSTERRPSWTPDGSRIVFQSNRPLTPGGNVKDFDIYMVQVPATATSTNTPLAESSLVRLTTNPGDDVEPTVGPTVEESRVARPNGQLAYASDRDDKSNDQFRSYFRTVRRNPNTGVLEPITPRFETVDFGEDFDIYLQDLSVENDTTNRSIRIVDTVREANEVLFGTGDTDIHRIDPNDGTGPDDDYAVALEIQGDDRRPTFSANGRQVIFCSDSNFRFPYPGILTPGVKDDNPDSDYDIIQVDIDSRGFQRLTPDTPTRTYRSNQGPAIDTGDISNRSEDIEPSAGAVPKTTSTSLPAALSGVTAPQSDGDIRRPSRNRRTVTRSGRSRIRNR
jgi:subtilisin family serine protease/Tol biopolymer transport system component